ncbi:DUF6520 family protein [Flavobacterium anhuiense]|uniref:DUF6520 family protein n=1 Tax=Flavobacterium anhuiense TaxID=459526 RepID=UPI003D96889B
MKTLFVKNVMPAAVAVLAVAGAFATTSMQRAEKAKTVALKSGYYFLNGQCNQGPVECSDIPKDDVCRLNITSGPTIYDRDEDNNCPLPLYRIVDGQ